MTVNTLTGAPSAGFKTWTSINWIQVEKQVRKLQMRIAKAIKEERYGKAKSLQWLLTHSFAAKLLAVKRVTSNKGGKTPGIDGTIWNTPEQKMTAACSLKRRGYQPLPLRRVYIPKKNGKKRPLGIPPMVCRGQQALQLLALEPIAETICDKNSYGFRPKRSCADAIEQCFKLFCRKVSAKWILEGDIKSCFDKISHSWLMGNIPMDKEVLKKWLKSGYVDKDVIYPTLSGTPQGGLISPTLLNLTMKGLEAEIASATKRSELVNLVVYADDFIVSGKSKEILENKVKPVIEKFLKVRGLTLSEEKTKITHIEDGFDFLGFNIRKYKDKLLTKPSKSSVIEFLRKIRKLVKSNPTAKTENLIHLLNPKMKGWAYYFRHAVSKKIYNYIDNQLFHILWRWAKRRHKNKGSKWVWRKYFSVPAPWEGTLSCCVKGTKGQETLSLFRTTTIPIRRHVKIIADANPYNPEYDAYFERRKNRFSIKEREPLPTF